MRRLDRFRLRSGPLGQGVARAFDKVPPGDGRHAPDVGHRESFWRIDETVDHQRMACRVDGWNAGVVALVMQA